MPDSPTGVASAAMVSVELNTKGFYTNGARSEVFRVGPRGNPQAALDGYSPAEDLTERAMTESQLAPRKLPTFRKLAGS